MPNLLPFDNRWKKYFAKEKELLSKALVGQKINSIEHIGATSVVMCGTYGTIDLLLAIPSYLDFLTIKNLLDKKGYEFIQRGSLLEELFFVRRNEKKQIVATIRLVEYASQKYKEYETFKIYLKALEVNNTPSASQQMKVAEKDVFLSEIILEGSKKMTGGENPTYNSEIQKALRLHLSVKEGTSTKNFLISFQ